MRARAEQETSYRLRHVQDGRGKNKKKERKENEPILHMIARESQQDGLGAEWEESEQSRENPGFSARAPGGPWKESSV